MSVGSTPPMLIQHRNVRGSASGRLILGECHELVDLPDDTVKPHRDTSSAT